MVGSLLALSAPLSATERSQAPAQRYEAARRLMQQGKFDAAAEGFRAVADAEDAPAILRAQALVASALMHENNREYERAAEEYREVQRRFAGTDFARRAQAALATLEAGGAQRGIEFRRRQDAAWDELFPAQAEAARGEWAAAQPRLERAIQQLQEILRDFRTHPKARDVAIALGNAFMLLHQYVPAQEAYRQAIAITQEQVAAHGGGGPGLASLLLDAEERYVEAVRAWRRLTVTRASWVVLCATVLILLTLRPWRVADREMLRLGALLLTATAFLSLLAAAGSYVVRSQIDDFSPIEDRTAAMLVALPGLTAIIATIGYTLGLRATVTWTEIRVARTAAVIGAVAAMAVATIIINAFALFPVLDSEF